MPKNAVSYTELTHQVVQHAPEPLLFEEILERVATLAPITTKNPRQTIRNAITSSTLIVATGDKRYGWKPRVINGSVLRLTLTDADLQGKQLRYNDEVRDALYPAFFGIAKRSDDSPVTLVLPNDTEVQAVLEHVAGGQWGTSWMVGLWHWLTAQHAAADDQLLITVLDGEARRYGVAFAPRSARDEAAITARNRELIAALLPYSNKPRSATIWEITGALLAQGFYKHPLPPDPLAEIITLPEWHAALQELGLINGWIPLGLGGFRFEFGNALPVLGTGDAGVLLDVDMEPPELPAEYEPGPARRPRPLVSHAEPTTTYVLRVTHRYVPGVWRDIEIGADQTLEDLHLAIQEAYRWDDDHLYSFFLNGQAWDQRSEIGSPWSDSPRHTHEVTLGNLNLKPKRKILYLFDYGDSHEFDVEVLAINDRSAVGTYPKIVGRKGRAPRQYAQW